MKRIVLILLLVSPLLGHSQAQLQIDNVYGVSTPLITPSVTQVKLYGTIVRNYSALFAFADTLRIYVGVLDSLSQPQIMDEVNKGYRSMAASGGGADSVLLDTVTVNVNPAFFQEGNNTVVIWPAAPGTLTIDTFYINVTYNSINELINNDINIHMGPNPANDKLYLGDPQNLVQQVRIRSLEGKLLGTGSTNSILWLNGFNSGVYLIELQAGNRVYTRKLVIRR